MPLRAGLVCLGEFPVAREVVSRCCIEGCISLVPRVIRSDRSGAEVEDLSETLGLGTGFWVA